MDWIKRNLYFVIGGVVALALMGLAGWFLYSKWQLNNDILEKLNGDYAELERLNQQNPHPGSGKVDNIKAANAERDELLAVVKKTRPYFQHISPIPDVPKVADRDFSAALSRTIEQLQHDATNASVSLLPNYSFSFEAQKQRVTFAAGSLEALSVQLGEIKAICDILFQARVNGLDNLRRERVSADDQQGAQTDYLEQRSITNELAGLSQGGVSQAVITPYEVTFRCFSAELASVLAGFASSPYAIEVKTINVEAAPVTVTETPAEPVAAPPPIQIQPPPQMRRNPESDFNSRYGIGPGSRYRPPQPLPPPVQQYAVAPAAPVSKGLPTVLDEKQLKVTMTFQIVKLLSAKTK